MPDSQGRGRSSGGLIGRSAARRTAAGGGEQPMVSASWRKALIALQDVIPVFCRPGSRRHTAGTHVSSSASKHCSSSVLLPLA